MSSSPLPSEATDIEILARVARGDLDAFSRFYDRHASVLYSLAMRILRDAHEAEEVLQEAMALIWERAPTYDPALGQPLGWAVAITRNKTIDRLRAIQRKRRLVAEAAPEVEAAAAARDEETIPGHAIRGETVSLMRTALNRLAHEQRSAIEMAFFGGLTHTEIAAKLGEPVGTVKARIRRGMMTMRDSLEGRI